MVPLSPQVRSAIIAWSGTIHTCRHTRHGLLKLSQVGPTYIRSSSSFPFPFIFCMIHDLLNNKLIGRPINLLFNKSWIMQNMKGNGKEELDLMYVGPTWLNFSKPCRVWRHVWIVPLHAIMADRTWGDRGTIISQNQLPLTWSLTKKLFWANSVD